jgi:hypothetical protein
MREMRENTIAIRADIYKEITEGRIQGSTTGRAVLMLKDDYSFEKKKRERKEKEK